MKKDYEIIDLYSLPKGHYLFCKKAYIGESRPYFNISTNKRQNLYFTPEKCVGLSSKRLREIADVLDSNKEKGKIKMSTQLV